MVEKEYKVKAASRVVGIAVGLTFILVGLIILVILRNLAGLLVMLIGAVALLAGLRPNKLLITSDAIETHQLGVKRYPYSQIRRVRMVARRFYSGQSKQFVQARGGGSTTRVSLGGSRYRIYPQIQIEGDFQYPLSLEMEYVGQLIDEDGQPMPGLKYRIKKSSRYDVSAIMRDVLATLPSGVEVDDSVSEYAATGSIPDVLTLPVENPKVSIGSRSTAG